MRNPIEAITQHPLWEKYVEDRHSKHLFQVRKSLYLAIGCRTTFRDIHTTKGKVYTDQYAQSLFI